jgi:hypothetical protein
MIVLVDYDNLSRVDRRRGLVWVVTRILNALGSSRFEDGGPVSARLYGGWYVGDQQSRRAEGLAAEIDANFPRPIEVGARNPIRVRVNVRLAHSLLTDPSRDLLHTYRPRGSPGGVTCLNPPFTGCRNAEDCPISPIHGFLDRSQCPSPGCPLTPRDILRRAEQKLVDTMIVADLIHVGLERGSLTLVSSDDDMWPGIRMSLNLGASIAHVHPRRGQGSPAFYRDPAPSTYREIHLD